VPMEVIRVVVVVVINTLKRIKCS